MEIIYSGEEPLRNDQGQVLVKETSSNSLYFAEIIEPQDTDNETSIAPEIKDDETDVMLETQDTLSWSDKETKLLLSLIEEIPFSKSKFKTKGQRWKEISKRMEEKGYKYSDTQCRNRHNTLLAGLKRISDHNKKTGRDRKKLKVSNEVKEKLLDMTSNKDSVTLPNILSTKDITTGTAVSNNILHEAIENDGFVAIGEDTQEDADNSGELASRASSSSCDTDITSPSFGSHHSNKSKKPTLVSEMRALREQQKVYTEKKLDEIKRSNLLFEQHNNLLKGLLDRLDMAQRQAE